MSLLKTLLLVALASVFTPVATAASVDIAGINVDDSVAIYNNTLRLNGAGLAA